MTKLWKNALVLSAIGTGIAMSLPALAATAVGPYYATPSWDQTLPAATRFIVLTNMNSEAVLDRETGLVWEKVPSAATVPQWNYATTHCMGMNTGGRMGWRLPTMPELQSLVDRSQSNPSLPNGHPFIVPSNVYWSASTTLGAPNAFAVYFADGGVVINGQGNGGNRAWCVRGGHSVDSQ